MEKRLRKRLLLIALFKHISNQLLQLLNYYFGDIQSTNKKKSLKSVYATKSKSRDFAILNSEINSQSKRICRI